MTATRIVRGATLAVGVGMWVVLAALLWRTSVPTVRLPHLDERATFGRLHVDAGRRYDTFVVVDWALATVAAGVAYVVVACRARGLAARIGMRPVNTGIVLGLLTVAAGWAAGVPFALVAAWWARRHEISRVGYPAELAGRWEALLAASFAALVLAALVLLLAQRLGRRWWLPATPAIVALVVAAQFLQPFASSLGTSAVRSERLRATIGELEQREGAGNPAVRVENVMGETRDANAFATGFGPSTHVVLWNTLLRRPFSFRAVRFVVAHELAHVAHEHVLRGLAWFVLLLLPVLVAVANAVDLRRAAAVPLAILLVAIAQLALLPARNAISRRFETEADWTALESTRDPVAALGLFRGFVVTGLEDPSPPQWLHVLLDDHPTPLQRVELARAWAERNR
jgi:STE24 endopeptidase